jgi:hypothetical protein
MFLHLADTEDTVLSANFTPMTKSQPLRIAPSENLAIGEHRAQSAATDCWVTYEYCISLVAITLRRRSRPVYLHAGHRAWIRGLPYVCVSLLLGWWGLPWGLIYTPVTIFSNLAGGCDITAQVRDACPSE